MSEEQEKKKKGSGKEADKNAEAGADAEKRAKAKAEGAEGKSQKAKRGGKGDDKQAAAELLPEGTVYKRDKVPRLRGIYQKEVVAKLMSEFGYKNPMEVPKMTKITVNMGLGEATADAKILDYAVSELTAISGQRPVVTRARKSIATFKLREGQKIGCQVTLRRERMYEFFDRLVSLALPRVRDFKGVSPKSFDGRGNFTLGIREQIIFPEIEYDKVHKVKGLNVTINTTAKTDDEGRALLRYMGMPFRS